MASGKNLIRIDKLFSTLGLLSRSQCKDAVKRGEIGRNGQTVKSPEEKIDREMDTVTYLGEPVDTREFVYYMFHKPAGCITANDDPRSKTVFDYMEDSRTDLSAVGRLDKDTTGILLITNDGELNHRLLSPKYHVPKQYDVWIDGRVTGPDIKLLERGLDIGDEKPTLPAIAEVVDTEYPQHVRLTITEGRFHQVKRMFEAVGKPVLRLHRAAFGPLPLDPSLPEGESRELTQSELEALRIAAGVPA